MYQLTQKAKKILSNARRIAMQFNADTIGTDHLLAGIIAENSCVAYRVLRDLGIEENVIFGAIQQGESELPDDRELRLGEDIKKHSNTPSKRLRKISPPWLERNISCSV